MIMTLTTKDHDRMTRKIEAACLFVQRQIKNGETIGGAHKAMSRMFRLDCHCALDRAVAKAAFRHALECRIGK